MANTPKLVRVCLTIPQAIWEKLKFIAEGMELEHDEAIRAILLEAIQRKEKQMAEWLSERRK